MPDRILVIDDDDGLRDSLQLLLAAEGYETVGAEDAGAAMREVERGAFDVILCDVRMPGVDGMELLPQLVQRLPSTAVVMMSAYGTEELALQAIRAGAYDYLAKPFQPAEALFTLRKAREREVLRRSNQLLRREVDRSVPPPTSRRCSSPARAVRARRCWPGPSTPSPRAATPPS